MKSTYIVKDFCGIIAHLSLSHQVLANDNPSFGYNAATGVYEDLMAAGIIDPAKVCSLL
jgi:chaperonin GroEL (HSP60 family)